MTKPLTLTLLVIGIFACGDDTTPPATMPATFEQPRPEESPGDEMFPASPVRRRDGDAEVEDDDAGPGPGDEDAGTSQ